MPPSPDQCVQSYRTSSQIGRLKKTITIKVANPIPPITLCITTFLCSRRNVSSLTFSLRSKIINFDTSRMNRDFFVTIGSSSNLSHGRGWRLEKRRRKKQLPRTPERINPTPILHIGQIPSPRQREQCLNDGEAKAKSIIARNPPIVRKMPRPVAIQIVSKVPFDTPRRMKFLWEHDLKRR